MLTRVDDETIVDVNEAFSLVSGYQPKEVLGRVPSEVGLWRKEPASAEHSARLGGAAARPPMRGELRTKSGDIRLVETSSETVRDSGNAYRLEVARDITEQARLEEELRRSGDLVTDFLQRLPVAFLAVDQQFRITYLNDVAEGLLRKPRDSLVGRNLWEEFPEAGGTPFHAAALRAMAERTPVEIEAFFEPFDAWFEVRAYPVEAGLSVYLSDVTERRRQGAAAAQLAAIVTSSDDAILTKTLEGVVTSWNKAAEDMYGYSADEAIGKRVAALITPPEAIAETDRILERIGHGERVDHHETQRVRKDGQRVDVSLTVSPLHDLQGQVVGASNIARDISNRKRQERELTEAEARYRALVEQIPAITYIWDARAASASTCAT